MRCYTFIALLFAALPVTAQDDDVDLVSLVLIPADLHDATKSMTVYDPNEDGKIDASEQRRIPWRDKIPTYDLNKDGVLTHLELSLRFARLREGNDVLQIDRNIASKYMRRHDTNGNGQLDPDEIARGWPVGPEDFDADKDGNISLREIAEVFAYRRGLRAEMGIMGVDQGGAIKIVNRFDKNQDGKLDADEWADASLPLAPADYDHDNDGKLTITEVATMLARNRMSLGLSKTDQMRARTLFTQFDRDRNGKISKEELAGDGSLANPDDLKVFDTNGDEEISVAEVEQYLAKARKQSGFMDSHAEAARRLMLRHDKNRDGFLTDDELQSESGAGVVSKSMLKEIDANDDQRINHAELAKHIAKKEKGS